MGREFHGENGRESGVSIAYKAAVAIGLVCLAIIVLWFAYRGIDVFLTLFAGIVMAVLLHTLAEPLTRWIRVPLWAAVVIVTLSIIGALTAGGIQQRGDDAERESQWDFEQPQAETNEYTDERHGDQFRQQPDSQRAIELREDLANARSVRNGEQPDNAFNIHGGLYVHVK